MIFWIIQIIVWSLYFYYTIRIVHDYNFYLKKSPPIHYFFYLICFCYFGIPLTMIMRYLINKVRRKKPGIPVFIITILLGSIALANVWFLEIVLLDSIVARYGYPITPYTLKYYGWEILPATLLLVGWSAIYLFIKFWEEWNEQKIIAGNALLLAENAQLKMLRYQLNPHFLFNALGSLRALIRQDQDKAIMMVSKISDFMRYSLISKTDTKVPLADELEAVMTYLEIETIRFADKLKIDFQIDEDVKQHKVPGFILHPLIENAIKYGMDSKFLPLHIEIKAFQKNNTLTLEVANSGKWKYADDYKTGTGTGLQNIRNRLRAVYPDNSKLIIQKSDGWVRVIIEIINTDNNDT